MRKVPAKKSKNKFVFVFVILLILVIVFVASFIISFNVMSGSTGTSPENDERYEQPSDMIDGEKTDAEIIADLKKENQKLRSEVAGLQDENAVLRSELETLTATLENQEFVRENASSTEDEPQQQPEPLPNTSETGL
ncbi:MAG: hypothetical protein J6V58_04000 [Clostridia bacterium]|nr:hypothetical protein [Clostridia bacterium]